MTLVNGTTQAMTNGITHVEHRVLSIQSHVVSGYVGNKSAVFPLQVLGFEVDAINSVQFSNHTGYGFTSGQVLSAENLSDVIEGLEKNQLTSYSHLLTGYIASECFLMKIVEVVKKLKQINPNLIYVCDPVMGDNGAMYVPEALLPLYWEHIISLADIVTPNQYEAELLTGIKIKSEADAIEAMNKIHARGVTTVVLSSTDLGSENVLVGLASSRKSEGEPRTVIRVEIPRLPATFTGSGDLFAALLLAWMTRTNGDLKTAVETTVSTLQNVLQRTYKHAQEMVGPNQKFSARHMELKLIQSKVDIEKPNTVVSATVILSA